MNYSLNSFVLEILSFRNLFVPFNILNIIKVQKEIDFNQMNNLMSKDRLMTYL